VIGKHKKALLVEVETGFEDTITHQVEKFLKIDIHLFEDHQSEGLNLENKSKEYSILYSEIVLFDAISQMMFS
jgi:hypothetical protein